MFFKTLKEEKIYLLKRSQPAKIGPQGVPRTSPFNVPKTSPKDLIWPSRGHPDLTTWRPTEMTSRGRPNLTPMGRRWKVHSGCLQDVLRTSLRGPSKYLLGTIWGQLLDVPKFLFTFLSELIRLTKSV